MAGALVLLQNTLTSRVVAGKHNRRRGADARCSLVIVVVVIQIELPPPPLGRPPNHKSLVVVVAVLGHGQGRRCGKH